jgi:hypothetical protein
MPKNTIIPAAGGPGPVPPVPEQSIRFDLGRATNLRGYSPLLASSDSWSISVWVKRTGNLNVLQTLFESRIDVNNKMRVYFDSFNRLNYETTVGAVVVSENRTARLFLDVTNWFHLLLTFNANTQIRWDINGYLWPGIQQLVIATPGDGVGFSWFAAGVEHFIGSNALNTDNFSGLMSDLHVTEGVKVATDFGAFDANGTWNRIPYAGVYGAQGFNLSFGRTVDLGEDFSGNANDFTVHTNAAPAGADQFDDFMERNYATIDVRDPRTIGLVDNGALDLGALGNGRVTMRPPANSGVWYYEKNGTAVTFDTGVSGEFDPLLLGDAPGASFNFGQLPFADVGPGGGELTVNSNNLPAVTINNARDEFAAVEYNGSVADPRVVTGPGSAGLQFDLEHNAIQHRTDLVWAKNQSSGAVGHFQSHRLRLGAQLPINATGAEETVNANGVITDLPDPGPGFEVTDGVTNNLNFNEFGNIYSAVSWHINNYAQNLIIIATDDDAEEEADGAGLGNTDVTSSDLEMVNEGGGPLQEVGMRWQNLLIPQAAEILAARIQFEANDTNTGVDDMFIFTEDIDDAPVFVAGAANFNISGRTKTTPGIAWSPPDWPILQDRAAPQLTPDISARVQDVVDRVGWAPGNSLVAIVTEDSGGTQVEEREAESFTGTGNTAMLQVAWRESANENGMSLFTYVGVGKNAQVMHGLNAVPEFVAVKRATASSNWQIYHSLIQAALPAPEDGFLSFNNDSAAVDAVTVWNDTAPDATFLSVGTASAINALGDEYVGFAMKSVEGFSKAFRYVGNGGTSGPLVYCGFKPRMVLIKRADGVGDWFFIHRVMGAGVQTSNAQFNQMGQNMLLNTFGAALNDDNINVYSSGFKITDTNVVINVNLAEYVGIAFAEAAIQNAKAAP